MVRRNEWQRFFDGYASKYMNEPFTNNTAKETDFVVEELRLIKGNRVLDVGCGTGRHSIELAKRAYEVTGIDLPSGMLTEAAKAAQEADVKVTWVQADASKFRLRRKFDAAICLCEGAFGLLGKRDHHLEHDLAILQNINAALKRGSGLILTAPSGFNKIRKYTQKDVEEGRFDPVTLTETFSVEWDTPRGTKSVVVRERGYVSTELTLLFNQAGFKVEHIWGGTAGSWGAPQHRTRRD
jgi:2-polyprenyl-3-methyl-5-hydroxy-6-metoxy-1,4-benzoquinol methylase